MATGSAVYSPYCVFDWESPNAPSPSIVSKADKEAQKETLCSYKLSTAIQYTPFFNFAYFTFFDDDKGPPPTREDVSALVNTIALISALLYTIGAAIPMSVGYDELEFWDWQYSVTGPYGCVGRAPYDVQYSDEYGG